jgi:hypothetical protein
MAVDEGSVRKEYLALSMRKEYQYCNWDLFLD